MTAIEKPFDHYNVRVIRTRVYHIIQQSGAYMLLFLFFYIPINLKIQR